MIDVSDALRIAREYLEQKGWPWNEPVSIAPVDLKGRAAFHIRTGPFRIDGRVVIGGSVNVFIGAETVQLYRVCCLPGKPSPSEFPV